MKTIILIGQSQMGKSTLGNYLFAGEVDQNKLKFRIGSGYTSCTGGPASAKLEWEYKRFEQILEEPAKNECEAEKDDSTMKQNVKQKMKEQKKIIIEKDLVVLLDTAGVGDTKGEEVLKMLELYRKLASLEELSCAVLVIKYASAITPEYKTNLQFYRKLLPEMFNKNVVIVVTAFSQEAKAIKKINKTGNTAEKILEELRNEFKAILGINYDIPVIPVELLADDDELVDTRIAKSMRKLIFNRCFEIPGLKVNTLEFPKPVPWVLKDEFGIAACQAKRDGILVGLEVVSSAVSTIAEAANRILEKKEALSRLVYAQEQCLKEKDNLEENVIHESAYYVPCTWFWWVMKPFDVLLPHPKASVHWTGGNPIYTTNFEKNLVGNVHSDWFAPLNATLTVTAKKCHIFASEIEAAKKNLVTYTLEIAVLDLDYEKTLNSKVVKQEELNKLKRQYEEIIKEITELEKKTLTIQQFEERLRQDPINYNSQAPS